MAAVGSGSGPTDLYHSFDGEVHESWKGQNLACTHLLLEMEWRGINLEGLTLNWEKGWQIWGELLESIHH